MTGTPAGRRGETARAFVGRAAEMQSVVAAADDLYRVTLSCGHRGTCRSWR